MNLILKKLMPASGRKSDVIWANEISIEWPAEFEEAWEKLDMLSPYAAEMIANLKYNRDFFAAAVGRLDNGRGYQYDWYAIPAEISAIMKLMREIDTFLESLLSSLKEAR